MFEYFGLKDVFSSIKKFWILLLVVLLIFMSIGSYFEYRNMTKASKNEKTEDWSSSAYFTIVNDSTSKKVQSTEKEYAEAEFKRLANTYKSLILSDLCNDYVFKKITTEMTEKEIIKAAKLNVSELDFNASYLLQLTKCNVLEQTNIINLYVITKDKAISEMILRHYIDYLENTIQQLIKPGSLKYIGGSSQNMNIEITSKSLFEKKWMPIILMTILGIVFELLLLFVYTLLNPTINRKSDFSMYDIPVISEL